MSRTYDLVIYGASGFTGAYAVEVLAKSKYGEQLTWAVAGRNETKLRKVLADVSDILGKNLRDHAVIIADSGDEQSLADMAKQAKVIVNTVGPYRLYGEAVVKAAIENGASHVDISGEPAFLESMQLKYGDLAKEKGVYVVGACGFDSIPCDLGVQFTRQHFQGDLNSLETFIQGRFGPAGYAINTGTYQTLILGLAETAKDGLGKMRRALMPDKLVKSQFPLEKRFPIFKHEGLESWCLPFPGSDKSIVNRSMYYGFKEHQERPFYINTFLRMPSFLMMLLTVVGVGVLGLLSQFSWTRKMLQDHPEICTFNFVKSVGPTRKQVEQTSFTYWFFAKGWTDRLSVSEEHKETPNQELIVRCDGADAGYVATSGCILSAAITILQDSHRLPSTGGVFTTASAFGHGTNIYERLDDFGVTFKVVDKVQD